MGILSWKLKHITSSFKLLILLLICFDLVAINITGKPFKHYLLQLAIPISLLAGEAYKLSYFKRILDSSIFQKVALGLCFTYALVLGIVYQYFRFDTARELVPFLEERIQKDDTLFAADSPSILYWYFDKKSPTKYIHPTLTVFPQHIKELKIDIKSELGKVLEGQPTYIVISDRYPHDWFVEEVREKYDLIGDLKRYSVYKLDKQKSPTQ